MHTPNKILPILVLIVCVYISLAHAAQPHSEPPTPPLSSGIENTLEAQLMGAWVLEEASTPGTPSGIGIRQKIFTPGRWEIIQKDPKTGGIIFRHGGTYRLIGDILEQKVEFATQRTKNYIGQVRRFRIKIEDDTYIQLGIGNPFNEVWKRLDAA